MIGSRLLRKVRYDVGTLIGRPRRQNILKILPKNSIGAELGVFKGEFTKHILKIAKPATLHLIDVWWTKFGTHYPDWGESTDFGNLRTRDAHGALLQVLDQYDRKHSAIIEIGDDVEILEGFENGYFDWVYLDSSHKYEHTLAELEVLDRKVKKDGLIIGHDWVEDETSVHHGAYRAIIEMSTKNHWRAELYDDFTQWVIYRNRS